MGHGESYYSSIEQMSDEQIDKTLLCKTSLARSFLPARVVFWGSKKDTRGRAGGRGILRVHDSTYDISYDHADKIRQFF
jgi:hypothetical protein